MAATVSRTIGAQTMFESSAGTPGAESWSEIPQTMKAVICHGPEDYRLEEVAVPRPGPGEALIKVEAVGICASDLKCYHGAAKFWGDANRPAWAETEAVPAGRRDRPDGSWSWTTEARQHWGVDLGRPGGRRADRAVLGVAGTAGHRELPM